jgi:prepilin-type N-terminal cleavage/methylation domain-containing protein
VCQQSDEATERRSDAGAEGLRTARRRLSHPGQTRHGVTLIELVTVLAIIVVVASMAAPRYADSLARYRADAAARRIVADLTLARTDARVTSRSRSVLFDIGRHEVQIPGVGHLDRTLPDYVTALGEPPYQVRIVSADFGGVPVVVFDGYGGPSSGGQVVVRCGSIERIVVVEAETGLASVP